jgi:prephenate dehydratase
MVEEFITGVPVTVGNDIDVLLTTTFPIVNELYVKLELTLLFETLKLAEVKTVLTMSLL